MEEGTLRKTDFWGKINSLIHGDATRWRRQARVYGCGVCLAFGLALFLLFLEDILPMAIDPFFPEYCTHLTHLHVITFIS